MKARRVHLIQLIYDIYTLFIWAALCVPLDPGCLYRSPVIQLSGLTATFLTLSRPDESDCEDCKLATYFSPSILVLVLFPCVESFLNMKFISHSPLLSRPRHSRGSGSDRFRLPSLWRRCGSQNPHSFVYMRPEY